jgi:hypothetical protein
MSAASAFNAAPSSKDGGSDVIGSNTTFVSTQCASEETDTPQVTEALDR